MASTSVVQLCTVHAAPPGVQAEQLARAVQELEDALPVILDEPLEGLLHAYQGLNRLLLALERQRRDLPPEAQEGEGGEEAMGEEREGQRGTREEAEQRLLQVRCFGDARAHCRNRATQHDLLAELQAKRTPPCS